MKRILSLIFATFLYHASVNAADELSKAHDVPLNIQTPLGSVQSPTFDGGMINSAGPQKNNELIISPSIKGERNISDAWANSRLVKRVLTNAAQSGKLDFVLREAEKLHLPASVALVPIVESHYQDKAISNKGAAGAWQLMPNTAMQYGLPKHQRFEFIPATKVALKHLQKLDAQFNNWELSFAAYHAGAGRIMKALKQNPHAKSLNELLIPSSTKDYVRRLRLLNERLQRMEASS